MRLKEFAHGSDLSGSVDRFFRKGSGKMKSKVTVATMLALLALIPSSGRAEPTPTLVSGHPQFANGKLEACELEYYTAIQDFDYRQGGLTAVLGSVSVRMGKRDLGGLIKLVLKDWNASDQTFIDPPRPVAVGFVANNGMSISAPDTILNSEDISGKLAVYSLAKLPSMMKEIMSGSISLKTARR